LCRYTDQTAISGTVRNFLARSSYQHLQQILDLENGATKKNNIPVLVAVLSSYLPCIVILFYYCYFAISCCLSCAAHVFLRFHKQWVHGTVSGMTQIVDDGSFCLAVIIVWFMHRGIERRHKNRIGLG